MSDRAGQKLADYRLIHLIGKGSSAEVFLGEHIYSGAFVAIKIFYTRLINSDEIKAFLNECRSIRLKHPHIIQILDFGLEADSPFLVMDYAPNGTLAQYHRLGTQVPPETILSYVKQLASAIQYAHNERIIHRDIKPHNLLIGGNGEILLSDFGIAVVASNSSDQKTGGIAGTAPYMAPEQLLGKPNQLVTNMH